MLLPAWLCHLPAVTFVCEVFTTIPILRWPINGKREMVGYQKVRVMSLQKTPKTGKMLTGTVADTCLVLFFFWN